MVLEIKIKVKFHVLMEINLEMGQLGLELDMNITVLINMVKCFSVASISLLGPNDEFITLPFRKFLQVQFKQTASSQLEVLSSRTR